MTTPTVEITPVEPENVSYKVIFGDSYHSFENGVVELADSVFIDMYTQNISPFRLAMEDAPGVNGIFHGEPKACVFKLVSAMLYDISGDFPVEIANISDKIIISNDGRVVFKPNIVRVVNGFVTAGYVSDIAGLGDNTIEITVEATPAYVNPSADTPVYSPTILKVILALNKDLSLAEPYSPVDSTPYILYLPNSNDQPAI